MKSVFLTIIGTLLFASSFQLPAADLNKPPPTEEKASSAKGVIYIYRNKQFKGGGIVYPIIVNGRVIGTLKSGTYLRTEVQPGEIQITSFTKTNQSIIPITIQSGEIKYVSTAYKISTGTVLLGIDGSVSLSEVDSSGGEHDIKGLDPINSP